MVGSHLYQSQVLLTSLIVFSDKPVSFKTCFKGNKRLRFGVTHLKELFQKINFQLQSVFPNQWLIHNDVSKSKVLKTYKIYRKLISFTWWVAETVSVKLCCRLWNTIYFLVFVYTSYYNINNLTTLFCTINLVIIIIQRHITTL